MNIRTFYLLLALLPLCSAISFAAPVTSSTKSQIYLCPSIDGPPLFTDLACPINSIPHNTHDQRIWHDVFKMIDVGMNTNAILGPDLESIMQCLDAESRYQQKLASIAERLKSASFGQQQGAKSALANLEACGSCSVSAYTYCQKASQNMMSLSIYLTKQR